jgi:hypothetical protein
MKKTVLIALASVMLVALCSFSSPQVSYESDHSLTINQMSEAQYSLPTANRSSDDCLAIFFLYADAMYLYATHAGTEEGDFWLNLAEVLLAALLECAHQ